MALKPLDGEGHHGLQSCPELRCQQSQEPEAHGPPHTSRASSTPGHPGQGAPVADLNKRAEGADVSPESIKLKAKP